MEREKSVESSDSNDGVKSTSNYVPEESSSGVDVLTDSSSLLGGVKGKRSSCQQGSSVSYERLRSLKQIVDRAIKEHRIFMVAGAFPSVRQALKQRGWLEKTNGTVSVLPRRKRSTKTIRITTDGSGGLTELSEEDFDPQLVARLLRNCTPDLLWALRSETVDWRGLARWQLVNRFPKALFTTKVGLSGALQHMQWFTEEGVSETLFPRCYCVNQPDEMVGFISDFRLTACFSVLRQLSEPPPPPKSFHPDRPIQVPARAVTFALSRAAEHIRHLRHEDVDDWGPAGGPTLHNGSQIPLGDGGGRVWDCEWDQFLTFYYQLAHEGASLAWESAEQEQELNNHATEMLNQYTQLRPHQWLDGTLSLWIVKPGARSCGRGITLQNKLEDILAKAQPGLGKETRFVVQKYIERPMLIYNTKFDIRQWFLVTSAQPLTIWMYRESYLRFCSQIFDMRNLHESVHLSNNAVQCRYQNCVRDPGLPDENMWDCYTFQTYLRSIGRADAWSEVIYPGMRAGIIGAMLASQDWLDTQRNCFELYGADFLLAAGDLRPWLLELNCSPCMAPSTSVTARMCAQCLEDVLRVVVDRREDRDAPTGMFELVYRQNSPPAPPYQGVALGVKGRRVAPASRKGRRRHRRKQEAAAPGSSSESDSSTESEKKEEEGGGTSLTDRHKTVTASPLKVIKAEMNVPLKLQKRVTLKPNIPVPDEVVESSTPPVIAPPPSAISAADLRVRLERLLATQVARERRASRMKSAQPNNRLSSSDYGTEKSNTKKKGKKSGSKFKGKVLGKNSSANSKENEVKEKKEEKEKKKNKESDNNNNIACDTLKPSEWPSAESNSHPTYTEVTKDDKENLLLQEENLRKSKSKLTLENVDDEDNSVGGSLEPGRSSLALVQEWRRRLEVTRESCEQMLKQLKAFRDPSIATVGQPIVNMQ